MSGVTHQDFCGDWQMTGHSQISRERIRQISEEGFRSGNDDRYEDAELIRAAQAYLRESRRAEIRADGKPATINFLADWPWDKAWWKPSGDPIRNLVKAGALIAAEIDRLQRKNNRDSGERSRSAVIKAGTVFPHPDVKISQQQAEAFAKVMAEQFGRVIQQMTDVMQRVRFEDIDRALGKQNGKSKANKKPAAKKPGQGRKRGSRRDGSGRGDAGKRNSKRRVAARDKAGKRPGR